MAQALPDHRDTPAPTFRLVDDCGGRFVIDAETGIVSLRDESWLVREAGAVHTARIEMRERRGGAHAILLRLRITGLVPQMADDSLIGDLGEDDRTFSQTYWTHYAAFFADEPAAQREPADFAPAPLGEAIAPVGEIIPAPAQDNLDVGEVRLALPPRARAEPLWALF